MKKLWCIVRGKEDAGPFRTTISRDIEVVDDLRESIWEEIARGRSLEFNPSDLVLWKPKETIPLHPENTLTERIGGPNVSQFAERLQESAEVGVVFENADTYSLSVIIQLPTLGQATMESILPKINLDEYRDIFVKVTDWGNFQASNIEDNGMLQVEAEDMNLPDFVTVFKGKMNRKPILDPTWMSPPFDAKLRSLESEPYFYLWDSIVDGESHETTRRAELQEVVHTTFITTYDWHHLWRGKGSSRLPLKEQLMNMIFFDPLTFIKKRRMTVAKPNCNWPLEVIVKLKYEDRPLGIDPQRPEELRKYRPHSDFLVSHSALPRLLVEVNSTEIATCPPDLVRMLITGAFIVRFANKFVSEFQKKKDFVLCAIFVWDDGRVTRYTLFQLQQGSTVYCPYDDIFLNEADKRVEFARILYNLIYLDVDKEQNEEDTAIRLLRDKIAEGGLQSVHTKNPTKSTGKRARTPEDGAGGGGGCDHTWLRTHGYEVKSDDIVDAEGIKWEPISKKPDNILTVYRPKDPDEEFIAKKLRRQSDELKILTLLKNTETKSIHVIPLIQSFDGWAILPKMVPLEDVMWPQAPESKVVQVCWGLIEGVQYLHGCCIAHRDIKPDNLVIGREFCLKIIDFDVAIQVKDENEEVDDQCGTDGWMAPEVENKLRHSPIRADRWACGRVLLYLLGKVKTVDKDLEEISRKLYANNPEERPSLLDHKWSSLVPVR